MSLPVLKIHAIKDLAVALLRAEVARANEQGAPESAFKGLYIAKHRWESLASTKKWPALVVHAKSTGGDGLSDQVPLVAANGSLHFHGLIGVGRDQARDLDRMGNELASAICDVLLENPSFLREFAYLERLSIDFEDGSVGADGVEYDVLMFLIEMDLALGHIEFLPNVDAPDVSSIDMTGDLGAVVGDPDGSRHTVKQSFKPE